VARVDVNHLVSRFLRDRLGSVKSVDKQSRMSINQPPASALGSSTAAVEAPTTSSQGSAQFIERLKLAAARIQATLGWSGVAAVSTGAVLALACTIWAMLEGVAPPLAIMVGYCALVGSACLCTALLVIQNLAAKGKARSLPSASRTTRPGSSSASSASRTRSRLWCDIEPGCPGSQESIAWGMAMIDAVKRGELVISPRDGTRVAGPVGEQPGAEQSDLAYPDRAANALKSWAKAHGHSPQFPSAVVLVAAQGTTPPLY